jgi:hypothetical protein
MDHIIRHDLNMKHRHKPTFRYEKNVFYQYHAIINNTNIQKDYAIWKSGRDYNTNRKIKIGGPKHRYLEKRFYIFTNEHNNKHYEGDYKLFTILEGINEETYHNETLAIRQSEEDTNRLIDAYNETVTVVQYQVDALDKWFHYIEFEGKKYGIKEWKDGVHRKQDCMGRIIKIGQEVMCRDYKDDSMKPVYGCETCGEKLNGYYNSTF